MEAKDREGASPREGQRNRGTPKRIIERMETESRGLLNVDLWAVHFPPVSITVRRRDHQFWLTVSERVSETELNTPRGHRATEEITSEFVKRP